MKMTTGDDRETIVGIYVSAELALSATSTRNTLSVHWLPESHAASLRSFVLVFV
jgi:hypothetical protein